MLASVARYLILRFCVVFIHSFPGCTWYLKWLLLYIGTTFQHLTNVIWISLPDAGNEYPITRYFHIQCISMGDLMSLASLQPSFSLWFSGKLSETDSCPMEIPCLHLIGFFFPRSHIYYDVQTNVAGSMAHTAIIIFVAAESDPKVKMSLLIY
jgi:hypothetical protein